MNEWKELKIDNLPPDILTGDYEFEYNCPTHRNWTNYPNDSFYGRVNLISNIGDNSFCVKYRNTEPLPHEEILKPRFWQMENPNYWRSITGTRIKEDGSIQYLIFDGWWDAVQFTNRESADIPPEAV